LGLRSLVHKRAEGRIVSLNTALLCWYGIAIVLSALGLQMHITAMMP